MKKVIGYLWRVFETLKDEGGSGNRLCLPSLQVGLCVSFMVFVPYKKVILSLGSRGGSASGAIAGKAAAPARQQINTDRWRFFSSSYVLSLPYVVDSYSALVLITFVCFNLVRNMTTSFDCAGKDLLYRMSLCFHALKEQMQELEAIRGTHLEQTFPCERNEVRCVIFVLSLLPLPCL